MRGNMMWTIDLVSLAVLRRLHRGRLSGFDFGTRKIEQLCSIAIACGMIAAAIWLGYDALGLIAAGHSMATPVGLSLAAVAGAINVFINFVAWEKVRLAARGRPSAIMEAQRKARRARLLSSVVVQVTMTGAALAKDPLLVAWLDAVGALLVCGIMFRAAAALLRDSAPDLLDRSTSHLVGPALQRALPILPAGFTLAAFRSRGAGAHPRGCAGLRRQHRRRRHSTGRRPVGRRARAGPAGHRDQSRGEHRHHRRRALEKIPKCQNHFLPTKWGGGRRPEGS
jgi:hypothetical protein